MSQRFQNDVAVVTGGGAGIGAATCRRLAREGAHVVAVDWDGESAEETVDAIHRDGGPESLAIETDVSDESAVAEMADRVDERFGAVDALVNNAGIRVDPKPVTEADEASWDRVLDVNLKGTAFCSKHLVPLIDDGSGGAVVNVASVGAGWARENWAQYDATKGGIVSMTHDMACDHADQDIRVNAVSPGWVITEYHVGDRTGQAAREFVDEKTTRGGSDENILERAAKPDELAAAICFLASDEASFLTGVNVPVDGGASVI
ncbi:3-oxoacyl-[acyl-carrier protein] reductase [Halomicrobium zhouii]|uniref:3-oxoacyl-[acyl-carrier protein] reductase n=1 Tax=Halomicrobium zhouii TaxID=767519 RepID=A0A1I6KDX1_9EURY|nr:SDR family oxidoreductase [Halomicrobium zhouii]SFR89407.1 3-oxoacyl-[acyl-carrier protein] reductase [Halomicrobium zhouii]